METTKTENTEPLLTNTFHKYYNYIHSFTGKCLTATEISTFQYSFFNIFQYIAAGYKYPTCRLVKILANRYSTSQTVGHDQKVGLKALVSGLPNILKKYLLGYKRTITSWIGLVADKNCKLFFI